MVNNIGTYFKIIQTKKNPEDILPFMYTSLHKAAEDNDLESIKRCIAEKVDLDTLDTGEKTALLIAAEKGHSDIVQLLLENGADADKSDEYGDTPMHFAVVGGYTEIVKLLITTEAININRLDYQGNNYLHLAVLNKHNEIALLLAQKGVPLRKKNTAGHTALDLAEPELKKQMLLQPVTGYTNQNNGPQIVLKTYSLEPNDDGSYRINMQSEKIL